MAHEIAQTSWFTDTRLKAYYAFNTGALTTDGSGEGHTLTAVSDPAEINGVWGKAADLDGTDAYSATDHADFRPTGNFTMGCWVKVLNNAAAVTLFQSRAQNTFVSGIRLTILAEGTVVLFSGLDTGTTNGTDYSSVISTTVVDNDVWHWCVGTWDGSYLRIYVDGALDGEVAWANAPVYNATSYIRVGCGCSAGTNTNFLTGAVDDVFLINGHALSSFEVRNLYDSQKTGFL